MIAVSILQAQLSDSSGGGRSVSPSATAVEHVATPLPTAPGPGPSVGEPSFAPLGPVGDAPPPLATTAPIIVPRAPAPVPTAVLRPEPTHRPTPAPTPASAGASIHLSGSLADLSSGASAHTLSATVRNASGQGVPGQTVVFSHAAGTGTVTGLGRVITDAAGVARAELVGDRAGPVTLRIQAGSASATLSFEIVAGALDRIILTPGSGEISPGGSQTFKTTAYDAFGNVIGNVSAVAVLSITRGGSCTASSCTASKPGLHTVTSVFSGVSNSASLMVHGKGGDDQ